MVKFLIYRTKEDHIEYTTFLERELITDKFIEIFETNNINELKERMNYLIDNDVQGIETYKVEILKPKNKKDNTNPNETPLRKKQKKYYEMIKQKKLDKSKENLKCEKKRIFI